MKANKMAITNNTQSYNVLSDVTSSHLYNRLNGKQVNASTASTITTDAGESVTVSISPEAQKTLSQIDKITENLRFIEAQFGEVHFSDADIDRINNIGEELDIVYGFNQVATSESYLYLENKSKGTANDLFTELNNILSTEEINEANQNRIEEIVTELDTLLSSEKTHAAYKLEGLNNEILTEVSALFIELGEATKGIEQNELSERQLKQSSDISLQIDEILTEHAALNPAKELLRDDKKEVQSLLNELDVILQKNGSKGVSAKLNQIIEQTSLSFIQILGGKKADNFLMGSTDTNQEDLLSVSNSKEYIAAQQAINAYNQTLSNE